MSELRRITFIGCPYGRAEKILYEQGLIIEAINLFPDRLNCRLYDLDPERLKLVEQILDENNIRFVTTEK